MLISRGCGGGVSMVYLSYIGLSKVEEKLDMRRLTSF